MAVEETEKVCDWSNVAALDAGPLHIDCDPKNHVLVIINVPRDSCGYWNRVCVRSLGLTLSLCLDPF